MRRGRGCLPLLRPQLINRDQVHPRPPQTCASNSLPVRPCPHPQCASPPSSHQLPSLCVRRVRDHTEWEKHIKALAAWLSDSTACKTHVNTFLEFQNMYGAHPPQPLHRLCHAACSLVASHHPRCHAACSLVTPLHLPRCHAACSLVTPPTHCTGDKVSSNRRASLRAQSSDPLPTRFLPSPRPSSFSLHGPFESVVPRVPRARVGNISHATPARGFRRAGVGSRQRHTPLALT